jgi:hypothetical protein
MSNEITLPLPPEFIALCKEDQITPEIVLRGFIADLCDLRTVEYSTNGSDERNLAEMYYDRVGYPYWHRK